MPDPSSCWTSTPWNGATEWQCIPDGGVDACQPSQDTDEKEEEVLRHRDQVRDAQTQAKNKPLTLDDDESPHQPSLLKCPCPEPVVHEHEPEPKLLPPVTPVEPELATCSKQQLPKKECVKMGSPSASWHDIEITPPQPANHKPPPSQAKTAMPCHS